MSRNRLLAAQVSGLVILFFAGMALAGSVALGKGKPSQETTSTTTQSSTSTLTPTSTSTSTSTVTTAASTGKVLVCHRTRSKKKPFHTINVSVHALPAHLKHGDTEGACVAAPTTSTSTQSTTVHGNNGKAKGHQK